jgi:coenzyme F420 hydrogenase subunit beta
MRRNEKGFLRPNQTEDIDGSIEAKIAASCPGLTVTREQSGSNYHPIWGSYEAVHLGWSTDAALRHRGSSGAALSAIGHHLIESGLVSFILTIRDDEDDPVSNVTDEARSYNEVFRSAGSRYGPSSPLAKIDNYLNGDEDFAIIAKPCDVSAIRALSKIDPRINQKVKVLLSFFCAGVPSREGALEVVKALGVQQEDVHRFQYRGDGWPGYAKATRHDGSVEKISYHDSWGKILSHHVQFRCKICPDGTGGAADIVCADAWHADEKGYPLFDDAEGRSLVLTRTDLGEATINRAVEAGELELSNFEISSLFKIQPGQTGRSQALLARLTGLLLKRGTRPKFKGFSIVRNSATLGFVKFLRNLIGTFRRA